MSAMQHLVLCLPPGPPAAQALYGLAKFDPTRPDMPLQYSASTLGLLPRPAGRVSVVAMVPATALSWHKVVLPAGLGRASPRLLAALHGLLEDRLLQEPDQLHLALQPDWHSGSPVWVAACEQAWLNAHLNALQEAGLPVQRLVPELCPATQQTRWLALGDENNGHLWCCDATQGVNGWPLDVAMALHGPTLHTTEVDAEPALAGWVQNTLQARVGLMDRAGHWRTALASDWNLAQFEWASRLQTSHWRGLQRQLLSLWQQPRWCPARRGLLALLLVQLLGLNAWAWMKQQQWQQEQSRWATVLKKTFPDTSVVVDAPLQMAREVAQLRRGAGQRSPQDFEALLQALGQALPPDVPGPERLNYRDGQLQWPAMPLEATQLSAFEQALRQAGYQLDAQGALWRLQALASTEKQP